MASDSSIVGRVARWLGLVGWFAVGISALRVTLEVYLWVMGVLSHDAVTATAVDDVRRLTGGMLSLLTARALRTKEEWGRKFGIYATLVGALFSLRAFLIVFQRDHTVAPLIGLAEFVAVAVVCRWLARPDIVAEFRQSDSPIPSWMIVCLVLVAPIAIGTSFIQ